MVDRQLCAVPENLQSIYLNRGAFEASPSRVYVSIALRDEAVWQEHQLCFV